MEVIKTQLSNIKEVTTKNEHYYKIHLDNNYMITAFYSNCEKCYKMTLFDMSKPPKKERVVHTLKLQELTNFKEVYKFCQIVEKQTQEQPTTKESCKMVEPTIKEETNTIITLLKQHGATNIVSNLKETHASFKFKMKNDNLTYRLFYLINDEGVHEIGTNLFSTSQNLDVMNITEFKNRLTLKPCVIKEETEHKNIMNDLTGFINVPNDFWTLENIALGYGNAKHVKWSDLFCTENDLLKALYQINLDDFKERGQYYVRGFHQQLHSGKMLSPKQITQLKRMACFLILYYVRDHLYGKNYRHLLKVNCTKKVK